MDESEAFRRAVERGAFAGMNKPKLEEPSRNDELADMIAAGTLQKIMAYRLGLSIPQLRRRIWAMERAEAAARVDWRKGRVERIRSNIAAYPGKSICFEGSS